MGSSRVEVMYAVHVDHDALWSVKVRNVTTVLDDETGPFDFLIWFFFEKRGKVESEISYSRPFFLKCTLMLMMLISLMQ